MPDLADRLAEKLGNVPENILAVQAALLRGIRLDNEQRALCVVNDTRTDLAGSHDPEHIALSPCARFDGIDHDERETIVSALKGEIISIYRGFGTPLHPVPD